MEVPLYLQLCCSGGILPVLPQDQLILDCYLVVLGQEFSLQLLNVSVAGLQWWSDTLSKMVACGRSNIHLLLSSHGCHLSL